MAMLNNQMIYFIVVPAEIHESLEDLLHRRWERSYAEAFPHPKRTNRPPSVDHFAEPSRFEAQSKSGYLPIWEIPSGYLT